MAKIKMVLTDAIHAELNAIVETATNKMLGAMTHYTGLPIPTSKPVVMTKHDKVENEWYLEDQWVSEALFRDVEFSTGRIKDPFCGIGRILEAAKAAGHLAGGWDIVNRTGLPYGDNPLLWVIGDSMEDDGSVGDQYFLGVSDQWSIVSNPPYGLVNTMLKQLAERKLSARCALFMPLAYLAGKAYLLGKTPLSNVLVCSPRPNCLPGELKIKTEIKGTPEQKKNGSGTKDFAWFIFDPDFKGRAQVQTLHKLSCYSTFVVAGNPSPVKTVLISHSKPEGIGLEVVGMTFNAKTGSMHVTIKIPAQIGYTGLSSFRLVHKDFCS